MNAISGPTSRAPFASFDPDTCSWRTSQGTLALGLTESSPTLPPSGSMRNGRLFAHPRQAPLIGERGYSSSLPTPKANDMNGSKQNGDGGPSLPTLVVHLLPTAAARDWKDSGDFTPQPERRRSLPHRIAALLPTPLASDGEKGGPNQRGAKGDLRLSSAVHLLPTPNTMDGMEPRSEEALARARTRGGCSNLKDSPLIRGERTGPRSADGSGSPGDECPGQLRLV